MKIFNGLVLESPCKQQKRLVLKVQGEPKYRVIATVRNRPKGTPLLIHKPEHQEEFTVKELQELYKGWKTRKDLSFLKTSTRVARSSFAPIPLEWVQ